MAKLAVISNDHKTITLRRGDEAKPLEVPANKILKVLSSGATSMVTQKDFREFTGLKGSEAKRLHAAATNAAGRILKGMATLAMQREGFTCAKFHKRQKEVKKDGKIVGYEDTGYDIAIRAEKDESEAKAKAKKPKTAADLMAMLRDLPEEERAKFASMDGLSAASA